eukprot:TRINITY_DN1995_c0_g1_i3.p1 TRINITY_DN1995_c0_g1~~TRINITY_DN1995_c0_g1_i3.p1  ORF type:complete len:586 (+),score=85.09 TRINITY_DN1995_c0_g1_i3:115-1758(+)
MSQSRHAEELAVPESIELFKVFDRSNGKENFKLREARIHFTVNWGTPWMCNVKVLVVTSHADGSSMKILIDTDPFDATTYSHKRSTRNFFISPEPKRHGRVTEVRFCFVVHFEERSIPSQYSYFFVDAGGLGEREFKRGIAWDRKVPNHWRTYEINEEELQRDVNWANDNFRALNVRPTFTKGDVHSVYHPKRFIHEAIDRVIERKSRDPHSLRTIKVCVDDIDDRDFVTHLIHAHRQGVVVQCIVDWRKMVLTTSDAYTDLRRSDIELIGVACMPAVNLNANIEVDPDMHTKFIIFDYEEALQASYNITFSVWGSNWEAGTIFNSQAACRLLDNVFQSIRGGMIQKYLIKPEAQFNMLYTFGRHRLTHSPDSNYRPHHAILREIRQAKSSIKIVLFLIGEMEDEKKDNVVNALIDAKNRGVDVQIILNGHIIRVGPNNTPFSMKDEIKRPVIPTVHRLETAGVCVYRAYGQNDTEIPYCPIHSKYCVIDDNVVIDGSFNWYNTSIYSHDMVVVVKDHQFAQLYKDEFYQILRGFRLWKGHSSFQYK